MNDHPDDLDLLLDRALQAYVDQAPPAGMEPRVLRHVYAAPRRWRFWVPAAAGVAAACVVLIVTYQAPKPSPQSRPDPKSVIAVLKPPVPQPSPPTPFPKRREQAFRRAPRQKQPALTEGERALLRFLQQDPDTAKQVLGHMLVAQDRPVTIEALNVEPLELTGTEIPNKETNP